MDRAYFQYTGLSPEPWLLDFGGAIRNSILRRVVKTVEYAFNLCCLGLHLLLSESAVLHVQYLPFLDLGVPFEIWFLRWARGRGVPLVYTVHNMTNKEAPDRHRSLYQRAYQTADLLVCHGKEACFALSKEFGIPMDKIRVIPHGPLFEKKATPPTHEARARLDLPIDEAIVLCMGVIRDYKGLSFLLDAWKLLVSSGGKGRLVIAGTGDARVISSIRERVLVDGLKSSVDLRLQYIPVDVLPLLHMASDILVYPYKAGTTSGALLTGLSYGKAIVATKLPFFREYLRDGQNAFLVDYGDARMLASALRVVLENPRERARIADALQHENPSRISWAQIAKATLECYESLLPTPSDQAVKTNSDYAARRDPQQEDLAKSIGPCTPDN
jgi:glycosyltransferase involved in cell wall biosynthesis